MRGDGGVKSGICTDEVCELKVSSLCSSSQDNDKTLRKGPIIVVKRRIVRNLISNSILPHLVSDAEFRLHEALSSGT